MDAKIRLWLLVALMSISAYPYTDCCSCIHYHAQMAFCDSDVAVRARFLGATVTDKYSEFTGKYSVITYEIETLQVLKGGDTIKNLSFIYTSTAYYCGYHIGQQDYNKDYLITGPMRNGRVEVIRCSYIVAWSTLTEAQIEGVERAYSCHCRVPREGEDQTRSCLSSTARASDHGRTSHHQDLAYES
ncbi:metalloproteinase inhibitor 1-like isoform X2 [Pleurodeles waltl]|uniref:metalloproteinase inhibitor 1-like isoform X2 n=1 Tax=Pleurodeles waltl TaxID=8319 RepID=UPI0037094D21